jgi:hypothetical protein
VSRVGCTNKAMTRAGDVAVDITGSICDVGVEEANVEVEVATEGLVSRLEMTTVEEEVVTVATGCVVEFLGPKDSPGAGTPTLEVWRVSAGILEVETTWT